MGMLIKFFRFEIWANPVFFSGGLVSKTGAILGLRKSFKCTFSKEKVGRRPLPGGCNVTIQMGMLVQFFGFEI